MDAVQKKAVSVYRVLCAEPGDRLIECLWTSPEVEEKVAHAILDAIQTEGTIVVNPPSGSDWETLTVKVKTSESEIECELEVGAHFVVYDDQTIGVMYNIELTAERAAALFA